MILNKSLLFFFLLIFTNNVISQKISPFIGYSNSFVSGRDVNIEDLAFFNSGVSAGVLFETGKKNVRFLSGFYFQQKGFQTKFNPEYKHKTNLNYLELNAEFVSSLLSSYLLMREDIFQVLLTDLYIMILAQKTLFASLGLIHQSLD